MQFVAVIDLFGLVVEGKSFEVFVSQKLADIFDSRNYIAQGQIELGQKVAVQLVDSNVVIENDVGAFEQVLPVFFVKGFDVFAFFLLFELDADDQIHNSKNQSKSGKLVDLEIEVGLFGKLQQMRHVGCRLVVPKVQHFLPRNLRIYIVVPH